MLDRRLIRARRFWVCATIFSELTFDFRSLVLNFKMIVNFYKISFLYERLFIIVHRKPH